MEGGQAKPAEDRSQSKQREQAHRELTEVEEGHKA
jgi:hypothetical protein